MMMNLWSGSLTNTLADRSKFAVICVVGALIRTVSRPSFHLLLTVTLAIVTPAGVSASLQRTSVSFASLLGWARENRGSRTLPTRTRKEIRCMHRIGGSEHRSRWRDRHLELLLSELE